MTDISSRADSGPRSAGEHAVTVPPTGQQYQIGAGRYRATVTELGAGLRELLSGDQPVIVVQVLRRDHWCWIRPKQPFTPLGPIHVATPGYDPPFIALGF